VGQKTRQFFRVDNFVTVSGQKACDVSKVSKFCLENVKKTWTLVVLNILCIVYMKKFNAFEIVPNLTTTREFYPSFHSNKQ